MYLIVSFNSAGLDITSPSKKQNNKMDDVIIKSSTKWEDSPTWEDRQVRPIEEVLVPKHCAINMLHVLCGLPPVSYYNPNAFFSWNDEIVEAIDNSYIKYDFIPKFTIVYGTDGSFTYDCMYAETYQTSKGKINAQNKHTTPLRCPTTGKTTTIEGIHSWDAWRRYLGYDLFNDVVEYFKEYLQMSYTQMRKSLDLVEVIALVKDRQLESYDNLAQKLKKSGKTSMAKILKGDFSSANYNGFHTNYPHIVQKSIKKKLVLNGQMIIKITDNLYEMIKDNDGYATLLDNGLVTIVDFVEDIDTQDILEFEGWVKVGTV